MDGKLLLQAYGLTGLMLSLFSQTLFFVYLYEYADGLRPSEVFFAYEASIGRVPPECFLTGQTITFVSIVIMSVFGNLLATRTRFVSLFASPRPTLWLMAGQAVSVTVLASVVYGTWFQRLFGTRVVPLEFVALASLFAAVILCVEEARKWLVRRNVAGFKRLAW